MIPRPCAPIRKPPNTRPIRPGSPSRAKITGPIRITANSTKNCRTAPCGAWSANGSSVIGPSLGEHQRHVALALGEPALLEPVDRPVGGQRADRGVDDLD